MRTTFRFAVIAATLFSAAAACIPPATAGNALDHGSLGLYDAREFRAVDGRCPDCGGSKAALWYFEGDLVAVPRQAQPPLAELAHGSVAEDIRDWMRQPGEKAATLPFLTWLGAPELIENATLDTDGKRLRLTGQSQSFMPIAKIASNRSYFNADSVAFFSKRKLRLRGVTQRDGDNSRFIARVLWPEDFRIRPDALQPEPLANGESLSSLIVADGGDAKNEFSTRLLWQRSPQPQDEGARRAVLAILLNGAQGDDDEAHGGHFGIATGWQRADGQWADWMMNNFYNLGSFSEKGIVASMLPMDNYMMDLNSGQSYYRPSYMLVAVLEQPRASALYQGAIQRVFDRFYRHHIEYDHAKANCAGLSIDTLIGLGWQVPTLGPTDRLKAVLGYFYSSATDRSFSSGRRTFNYLTAEQSRLYPRAAFETLGHDLLTLVSAPVRTSTPYEQMLHEDVEAIMFVRIPQIPSSRAIGTFPVASFDEYMARVPKDRKDWKIVPVDPRPFPDELRDRPIARPLLSDNVVGVLAVVALLSPFAAAVVWYRRRKARRK